MTKNSAIVFKILLLFVFTQYQCYYTQTYRKDTWGVEISITEEVKELGKINTCPVVNLSGELYRNGFSTNAFLGAMFIPEGSSMTPQMATSAMKKLQIPAKDDKGTGNTTTIPLKTLFELPDSKEVFIIYDKTIPACTDTQQVKLNAASLRGGLKANTTYQVWLLVKKRKNVFYKKASKKIYKTPKVLASTKVTMEALGHTNQDNASQHVEMSIHAEAKIEQLAQMGDTGFLWIKEATNLSPMDVLLGALEKNKFFPTSTTGFQAYQGQNVVVYPTGQRNSDGVINLSDARDPQNKLTPGATYRVYAYVQQKPERHFYISEQYKSITLPKAKLTLAMDSASVEALIQFNDKLMMAQAKLAGTVSACEGVKAPVAGFLLIPNGSGTLNRKTGSEMIAAATSKALATPSPTLPAWFKQSQSGINYTVCIATGENDSVLSKALEKTCDIDNHLSAGSTYQIYYWVQDAAGKGSIFMSENSVSLALPKVQASMDQASITKRDVDNFELQADFSITALENAPSCKTFFVFNPGVSMNFDKAALSYVLNALKEKEKKEQEKFQVKNWILPSTAYILGDYSPSVRSGQKHAIPFNFDEPKQPDDNPAYLKPKTHYNVLLGFRHNNVLFLFDGAQGFKTPEASSNVSKVSGDLPEDTKLGPYSGCHVEINLSKDPSKRSFWIRQGDKMLNIYPHNGDTAKVAAIKAAIDMFYFGPPLQEAYVAWGIPAP